jgi:hypothetical protein
MDINSELEIIFVNVWDNVDGKLKFAGQKPMLKENFDEMQRKKDFSKLARTSWDAYGSKTIQSNP